MERVSNKFYLWWWGFGKCLKRIVLSVCGLSKATNSPAIKILSRMIRIWKIFQDLFFSPFLKFVKFLSSRRLSKVQESRFSHHQNLKILLILGFKSSIYICKKYNVSPSKSQCKQFCFLTLTAWILRKINFFFIIKGCLFARYWVINVSWFWTNEYKIWKELEYKVEM